jgi:hypothetical protein
MSDLQLRQLSAALLSKELGRMDDISAEFANTVANVYYRFVELGNSDTPGFTPARHTLELSAELAKILSDYEAARRMVAHLRQLATEAHPSVRKAAEDLYISLLKYNVPFDENKSLLRMKAERLLNSHKVKEIPNLAAELGLR